MKLVKFLLAMTMVFAGTLQATSIILKNNSTHITRTVVRPWGDQVIFKNKNYSVGGWKAFDINRDDEIIQYIKMFGAWIPDLAARLDRTLKPGESGDVYSTEGIEYLYFGPSDKVKVVGKQGEEYKSGQKIDIPKGMIWELEIQDK